jgi:hypothetical protein
VDQGDTVAKRTLWVAKFYELSVQFDVTRARLINSGEHFGKAGFSRPVLPCDRVNLRTQEVEVHAFDDVDPAKGNGDAFRAEAGRARVHSNILYVLAKVADDTGGAGC